ncbi:MAG TPA: hypothetical protein VLB44_10595 [Kofleriaceae bacterium]|nr:hypothetical protein [Kofleriaceae bacterium]
MRVGELLLQRRLVDWETLALAIGDQAASGMRLCSFLVERGVISFDQASRVLGELHGSAAVLQRHLEGRDPGLASLLPEGAARKLVALPIGRLGNGALIVCVRDPSQALGAMLSRLLREEPVLAVAPAHRLERLIEQAYAARELDADDLEEDPGDDPDIDVPIEVDESSPAADDFAIDVEMPAAAPKAKKRAMSVVIPVMAAPPPAAQKRDSLDATLAAFRDIDEPNWLFDVAMQYIEKHWTSSLLLAVNDKRAVGTRGHGARITPSVARGCVVDVADVSLLEAARIEKRIIEEPPSELGAEHEMLARLLGKTNPIAAPIMRGAAVSHVLLLGEPVGADREDAMVDLGLLVEAMGEALTRM